MRWASIALPRSNFAALSSSFTADDVCAEGGHQSQGSGAAAGACQAGDADEPVGLAERHRRGNEPDGTAGPVPTAGCPPGSAILPIRQEPRALQGSVDALTETPPPICGQLLCGHPKKKPSSDPFFFFFSFLPLLSSRVEIWDGYLEDFGSMVCNSLYIQP